MTQYDLDRSRVPEGGVPMTEPDYSVGYCGTCGEWRHVETFSFPAIGPICVPCWKDKFPGVPYGEEPEE